MPVEMSETTKVIIIHPEGGSTVINGSPFSAWHSAQKHLSYLVIFPGEKSGDHQK